LEDWRWALQVWAASVDHSYLVSGPFWHSSLIFSCEDLAGARDLVCYILIYCFEKKIGKKIAELDDHVWIPFMIVVVSSWVLLNSINLNPQQPC